MKKMDFVAQLKTNGGKFTCEYCYNECSGFKWWHHLWCLEYKKAKNAEQMNKYFGW